MNNQQITKIVNFLQLNYDFHSPYSYIVDGNFIKLIVEKQISLDKRMDTIINGKHHFKVTNCILSELQMLGQDFKIILEKAKTYRLIKCSHTFQSVDKCILDNVNNQSNLIVCSQDKNLRRMLRHRKIGLMYIGPDQRVTMEDIERKQFEYTKREERNKFRPNQIENKQIQQYRQQQQVKEKIKKKKQQFKFASQRGIQLKYLKKKIAKGPNPLAAKKKKVRVNSTNEGKSQNVQSVNKPKRIRKRNKKIKHNVQQ